MGGRTPWWSQNNLTPKRQNYLDLTLLLVLWLIYINCRKENSSGLAISAIILLFSNVNQWGKVFFHPMASRNEHRSCNCTVWPLNKLPSMPNIFPQGLAAMLHHVILFNKRLCSDGHHFPLIWLKPSFLAGYPRCKVQWWPALLTAQENGWRSCCFSELLLRGAWVWSSSLKPS